jgi:sugar lactone lactonase YvrE
VDLDSGMPDTSSHLLLEITHLSAPYQEPQLYWVDTATHKIQRSDLDGSNVTTLVTGNSPIGFEVDLAGDRIYWTEAAPGKVRRSALDGTAVTDLATGLGFPFGIGLDPSGGTLVFADITFPGHLRTVGVGGGAAAPLLPTSPNTPYGLATDPAAGKMYWTEFGFPSRIRRANVDGTGVETLIDSASGNVSDAQGIALDVPAGKMYWTDLGQNRIRRANLDGSGPELLVDFIPGGLDEPTGIAIDPIRGKMYWTDTAKHTIERANLDGTSIETVLDVADGLSFPRDVYVDPGTGCQPPTEALTIDGAQRMGGGAPKFSITDPNAPVEVTGYNVYRSSDPSVPKASWPLVALDVPDAEPFVPGIQWTDASGDASPTGIWHYTVVAYNAGCPVEGPQ